MNRWKSYILMAAGLAALSVVGTFTAKPLLSQIKAALVQNVNEPGLNPYQFYVSFKQGFTFPQGTGTCLGAQCNFTLPAVPGGKRLVITNITGNVYVDTPGIIQPLVLFGSGVTLEIPAVLQAGTYLPINSNQASNMLGFNAPILTYFDPGTAPMIAIIANGLISDGKGQTTGSIVLSGHYVNLP
jgi:hypothetical protein